MPTLKYPTHIEIDVAIRENNRKQLAIWYRFLPSPGTAHIGKPVAEFEKKAKFEEILLDRIVSAFSEMGGMNAEISKSIGWDETRHL